MTLLHRLPPQLLLLLSLAVALPLAACGGDDAGSADPTATARPSSPAASSPASASPTVAAEANPVLPASVTDKDGKIVSVTDVSRIVVLNGDLAEVVYALGMGGNVVGLDISATYPPEAKAKQNIGYQRTLSAEGILSLKPTLILGNEAAGPPPVIAQIKSAGVTTVILKDITTIDGINQKILDVGNALGVPNRAKAIAAKTQTELDAAMTLAKKATAKPNVAFLYLRGASTQQLMGKGSRADVLIAAANGVDSGVAAGVNGSAPITPESLVASQPDVLLVLTAGLESVGGVNGVLAIPGVAQTPAGKNKKVIDLDDQYLLGLGPRSGQALMELVKLLHPELK